MILAVQSHTVNNTDSKWTCWGSWRKWTQVEKLWLCEGKTLWFLRQIFGLVLTRDRTLLEVCFESSVMSSAATETLDNTVLVDTAVKRVMQCNVCVSKAPGARNLLWLMLQPSPASRCYFWERKPHSCYSTLLFIVDSISSQTVLH